MTARAAAVAAAAKAAHPRRFPRAVTGSLVQGGLGWLGLGRERGRGGGGLGRVCEPSVNTDGSF